MNVSPLRLYLQQPSQRIEPVEILVPVVGKFSPKVDPLDLSFECEPLVG